MKRRVVAASWPQTTPALITLTVPAFFVMAAGSGASASLASVAHAAATLAATLFTDLLAVAATLAAAG